MAIADEMDPEDWQERRRLADEALADSLASGDDAAFLDAFVSRDFMMPTDELLGEEHEALSRRALAEAEARDDPVVLSDVLRVVARRHISIGDLAGGKAMIGRIAELADAYGLPVLRVEAASNTVGLAMADGDMTELERQANILADIGSRGFSSAWASYGGALFELRLVQGRLEEFASLFADTPAASYPGFRPGLAMAYLESGNHDRARALFERDASDGFASFPRDTVWTGCLVLFAELAVALADRHAAETLHTIMVPLAPLHAAGGPVYYGQCDRAVGRLAAFLGRPDEAQARLRASLEVHRSIGARYWGARNAVDVAEVLVATGRAADDVEVKTLLDEARAQSAAGDTTASVGGWTSCVADDRGRSISLWELAERSVGAKPNTEERVRDVGPGTSLFEVQPDGATLDRSTRHTHRRSRGSSPHSAERARPRVLPSPRGQGRVHDRQEASCGLRLWRLFR
jgi:hypothetical protein